MNVPYVSQIDNAPRRNDCGPACVAMLAGAINPSIAVAATVTGLSERFDATQDGTTRADLLLMGDWLGVPLRATTAAEYPYIALVDYRALPVHYQPSGDFGHWIVRLSPTRYHDPLWRGTGGASLTTTQDVLDAAERAARRWSSIVPNRVTFKETMPMTQTSGKARIGNTPWNVRRAPSTSGDTATGYLLQPGQEFDVLGMVTGADGRQWGRVSVTVGGVRVSDGYLRADGWRWVSTTTPPQPQPQPQPPAPTTEAWKHPKYLLGISCLNDHNAGMDALSRGCRSVLFMDGLLAAIQAAKAYPDAVIFNRSWFQHAPDPVWLADHHGAGLKDVPDNLWSTCANECDWICYGTPEELRRRFEYEKAFVQALWAKNPRRKVVIGEFSHGTPDVNNEAIVRTYRDTYYAFAQQNPDRVRIGWHLYTKGRRFGSHPQEVDGAPIAPEWYETRDASFWYQCGSDPRVRHMCGETGVESTGGGFAHANYSDQQFREWCSWWLETRRNQPVAMDAACLFQYGDHPNWRGYNVRRFAEVLTDFWQGRQR